MDEREKLCQIYNDRLTSLRNGLRQMDRNNTLNTIYPFLVPLADVATNIFRWQSTKTLEERTKRVCSKTLDVKNQN